MRQSFKWNDEEFASEFLVIPHFPSGDTEESCDNCDNKQLKICTHKSYKNIVYIFI